MNEVAVNLLAFADFGGGCKAEARALDGVHDMVAMLMCTQHTIPMTNISLISAGGKPLSNRVC